MKDDEEKTDGQILFEGFGYIFEGILKDYLK